MAKNLRAGNRGQPAPGTSKSPEKMGTKGTERERTSKIRSGTKGTGTETPKTFRNGERIFRPVPFLAHLCLRCRKS